MNTYAWGSDFRRGVLVRKKTFWDCSSLPNAGGGYFSDSSSHSLTYSFSAHAPSPNLIDARRASPPRLLFVSCCRWIAPLRCAGGHHSSAAGSVSVRRLNAHALTQPFSRLTPHPRHPSRRPQQPPSTYTINLHQPPSPPPPSPPPPTPLTPSRPPLDELARHDQRQTCIALPAS